MGKAEDDLRTDLVGSELYSVVFVRDYVQLYLDAEPGQPARGAWQIIVNLYTLPTVIARSESLAMDDVGWADALRRLVNRRIVSTSLDEGVEVKITFDSGEELVVSLRSEDRWSDEALEVMHGTQWWVY